MPGMPHTNLTIRERTDAYIHARYQHPAWVLLASRRGPLVLSCLRGLFDEAQRDVGFDDALQSLAQALADHANHAEFDIGTADCTALARKELRAWIKRELVVERGGNLYATDALLISRGSCPRLMISNPSPFGSRWPGRRRCPCMRNRNRWRWRVRMARCCVSRCPE